MTTQGDAHHRLGTGESLVTDLHNVALTGATGVVWALDSPQMNANLVTLRPGDEIPEHVNDEVDVLLVAESGFGELSIDGQVSPFGAASIALIPRGARRSIQSASGLVYFSIHQRRSGLTVGRADT
jgi:quercetin dioxygenase-like cupin family protein